MQKYKVLFITILILLFIVFMSIISIFILNRKLNNANSYKTLYESSNKEAITWKDESGKWRSKAEAVEVTNSELKNVKELEYLSEEFEGIKNSLKNLENYNKIGSITTIDKTIKLKDTTIYTIDNQVIKASTFQYNDKWDNISGIIVSDSIQWKVFHKDSLEVVQYWDRTWFLGKKKYFTEIKSANPNTKIDYQKSIKSKRKKGLFKL